MGGDGDLAEVEPDVERGMLHSVVDDILLGGENGHEEVEEEEEGDDQVDSEDPEEDDDDDEKAEDMFSKAVVDAKGKVGKQAAVERVERQAQRLADALAAKGAPTLNQKLSAGVPPDASIFVRGLSLDTTREQLFQSMRTFGQVASCRVVVNKETSKAKGTAFVDFLTAAAAAAAVKACALGRSKDGPGVVVAGRQVDVDFALDSEGARKLAAEKAGGGAGGGQKDRRNLYLVSNVVSSK